PPPLAAPARPWRRTCSCRPRRQRTRARASALPPSPAARRSSAPRGLEQRLGQVAQAGALHRQQEVVGQPRLDAAPHVRAHPAERLDGLAKRRTARLAWVGGAVAASAWTFCGVLLHVPHASRGHVAPAAGATAAIAPPLPPAAVTKPDTTEPAQSAAAPPAEHSAATAATAAPQSTPRSATAPVR